MQEQVLWEFNQIHGGVLFCAIIQNSAVKCHLQTLTISLQLVILKECKQLLDAENTFMGKEYLKREKSAQFVVLRLKATARFIYLLELWNQAVATIGGSLHAFWLFFPKGWTCDIGQPGCRVWSLLVTWRWRWRSHFSSTHQVFSRGGLLIRCASAVSVAKMRTTEWYEK